MNNTRVNKTQQVSYKCQFVSLILMADCDKNTISFNRSEMFVLHVLGESFLQDQLFLTRQMS